MRARAASASRLAAGQAICSRWSGMEWDGIDGMSCHASGSGRGSSERDVAAAVAVRSDLDGNQLARRWLADDGVVGCIADSQLQTWEGQAAAPPDRTACCIAVRRGARG